MVRPAQRKKDFGVSTCRLFGGFFAYAFTYCGWWISQGKYHGVKTNVSEARASFSVCASELFLPFVFETRRLNLDILTASIDEPQLHCVENQVLSAVHAVMGVCADNVSLPMHGNRLLRPAAFDFTIE